MENMNQLFIEAGTLLFVGMVFVYAFLGLLIFIINFVLAPLAKKFPDPVVQTKVKKFVSKSTLSNGVSPAIVAAITGAVTQYRQQHTNLSINKTHLKAKQ
ncbi:MAG: OadG family protein [Alteromonadaceae bacterium]|nr:OadG family protein [Alteromonadaceae bacterium]